MEEPMQEDWDLCEDSPQAKKKKYLMTLDLSLMSPPIPTTKLPQTTTFEKCQPSPGPESAYSSSYGKSPQVDNKWINTPNPMVGTPGQSSSGFETGTDSRGNTPMPKFNYECSPLRDACYDSTIDTLRRNYSIIKQDFMPEDTILDQCHEEDIIEDDFFEKIREASKKRSRASDLFVKALVEYLSKSSDESVRRRREQKLSNIFERNGLKYFLQVTDAEKGNDALKSDREFTGKELETILDFNADALMDGLEPRNIIDQLLVAGMLSFDDHEDLVTTDSRRRRVEFLINHVKHDIGKNFPIFRKVLKDHRPHLEKKLMTTQKKSTQSQALSGLRMEFEGGSYTSTPSFGGAYTIQMKLNFTSSEDVKDIEMETVTANNCSTNLSLDEEAMECCDAIIEGFSYSSIRIHLKPLSPVSARKLTEAIRTNPGCVQRWIEKLIAKDNLTLMKKRGLHHVTVEVTSEQIHMENQQCTCISSRETVVEAFSKIAVELRDVEQIGKEVLQMGNLSTPQKRVIQQFLDSPKDNQKNEDLLRLLLELPERCICVFEMMLIKTKQHNILEIIEQVHRFEQSNITIEDIKENASFLCEEIEPKYFANMLTHFERTTEEMQEGPNIQDIINSNVGRAKRSRAFLDFMLQAEDDTVITTFVNELERLHLSNVLDILKSTRDAKSAKQARYKTKILRSKILCNYSEIIEEIDAESLHVVFKERKVFGEEDLKQLNEGEFSIREKNVLLLKMVMKTGYKAMVCLIDSFKITGYDNLLKLIQKAEVQPYSSCPTLQRKEYKREQLKFQFAIVQGLEDCEDTPTEKVLLGLSTLAEPFARRAIENIEVDNTDIFLQNVELQCLNLLEETSLTNDVPADSKIKKTSRADTAEEKLNDSVEKNGVYKEPNLTSPPPELDKKQYVLDWVLSCANQEPDSHNDYDEFVPTMLDAATKDEVVNESISPNIYLGRDDATHGAVLDTIQPGHITSDKQAYTMYPVIVSENYEIRNSIAEHEMYNPDIVVTSTWHSIINEPAYLNRAGLYQDYGHNQVHQTTFSKTHERRKPSSPMVSVDSGVETNSTHPRTPMTIMSGSSYSPTTP